MIMLPNKEVRLTLIERKIISYKSGSPEIIRKKAVVKESEKICIEAVKPINENKAVYIII